MRDKVTRQCPQTTTFEEKRRAEADSNRGPSAYQPNALLLGLLQGEDRGNRPKKTGETVDQLLFQLLCWTVTKTMSVAPLLMNNLDNSKQKTSNLLSPAPLNRLTVILHEWIAFIARFKYPPKWFALTFHAAGRYGCGRRSRCWWMLDLLLGTVPFSFRPVGVGMAEWLERRARDCEVTGR